MKHKRSYKSLTDEIEELYGIRDRLMQERDEAREKYANVCSSVDAVANAMYIERNEHIIQVDRLSTRLRCLGYKLPGDENQ